jgi:16S rRNA (adenine(1408)-N(1))-methyltransferase
METIRGKMSLEISAAEFTNRIEKYPKIHLDLGTGDGRFVRCLAQQYPGEFFLGLDACRENLRENSLAWLPNSLYVIASAQSLPQELTGLIDGITINFPWGSLLESLLTSDPALLAGLDKISRPGANLQIRLNGGALAEAGWSLEAGTQQVQQVLSTAGFRVKQPAQMNARDLRACPTTWAKRLAVGRDPRAFALEAQKVDRVSQTRYAWPAWANL